MIYFKLEVYADPTIFYTGTLGDNVMFLISKTKEGEN
jgi:hypothetical protein